MSSTAAVPTAGPSALKTAIAGSIALAVAMGFGRFSYTLILPGMMDGLGLSAAQVSWIASANYFGYLAGAILAGYGWATGRERRLAVGSIVATALLLLAMALTTSVPAFLVIRLLAGVASGFAMVFTTAIVLSIGIALSSVMIGVLTVWHSGWTGGWIGGFVLSLLGALVVQLFLPAEPVTTGTAKREPPIQWTRDFAATTAAYGIFGFGYIITATFLVEIVHDGNGGNAFEAFVWCVTGLAAAPSVAYWTPAARRFGLARTFVFGCAVEAAGVAASVLVPLPAGPVIGGILLGGTFIMVTAYGLQIGRMLAPESPRRALAVMTAAFGIGQIIGPIVAGYLAEWTGSFTLASLAAAAGLVVSAATILTVRRL